MQPAMPSSVALWARGFAAELEDDRAALLRVLHRTELNPLGSAAGYGVPNLPLDRDATRAALGFERNQEPVTAVQLSRGKAEAAMIFEIAIMLGDLGRLASDLLLFYTSEFAYVSLPAEMTTGSSIMPQKRNPDVFELVRAAPATIAGALQETLGITAKLTSGYHRDLQRLKAPLFRSIDLADDVLAIMAHALPGVRFQPDRIELGPELFAAEQANELVVKEGLPFREAYRRVAARLRGKLRNEARVPLSRGRARTARHRCCSHRSEVAGNADPSRCPSPRSPSNDSIRRRGRRARSRRPPERRKSPARTKTPSDPRMSFRPLVLVDGSSYLYSAFHALPPLSDRRGAADRGHARRREHALQAPRRLRARAHGGGLRRAWPNVPRRSVYGVQGQSPGDA